MASHDSTRFIPGSANFLTIDEESSGAIDMESILGPGKFLVVDQAHYSIPGEVVEGGQLLVMHNPTTFSSAPEVSVTGFSSATVIVDGDITPSTGDNTDFGNVNTGATNVVNFNIKNTGAGALVVSGISFAGADASQFSLVSAPVYPATVAAGGTLVIAAKFAPTSGGVKNATIHIMNSDINESDYDFALIGTGVEIPEINVKGNSTNIIDGDVTPGTANNTDFGTVTSGGTVSKTFMIQNNGAGNLTVSSIGFIGANASEFALTGAPTFPVTIATSASYSITAAFTPAATGVRTATLVIASNDVDEASYDFAVSGICNAPPSTGGVKILGNMSSIKVFPNPTSGEATLSFDLKSGSNISISVMDMQGKEAIPAIQKNLKPGQHTMELNTSTLQNGVYFLRISDNNSSTNTKLVVIH